MPPVEYSSNWDFTPVINLLHSPTYGSDPSTSLRHPDSSEPGGKLDDVLDTGRSQEENVTRSREQPRLGDFGFLLSLLGQSTATNVKTALPERPSQDTGASRPPVEEPKQIKILKRRPRNVKDADNLPKTPPPSSPRTIPVPSASQARNYNGEVDVQKRINDCDVGDNVTASERNSSRSSAEADSDGNLDIFDAPLQKKPATTPFISPQVNISAVKNPPLDTPPSSYSSTENVLNPEAVKNLPKSNHASVQPITYKSATERRIGLLTKLLNGFPDYADIVSQVGRPERNMTRSSSPRPIHVFIDVSNIMVGFHDSMKVSRGIPITTRIPRLPLSFENFSLILERGRWAKKRVLVGSDRFPPIDEAEKMGYETSILDRVQKGRYLAQRQLRSRKGPRLGTPGAFGCSETNGVDRARWVEQGVDEILHLKILESLIDTDEPTTMVLATGDAAEAEYSQGFMKMVERALKRGWTVELVSFSQTTSSEYRRAKFRGKWGDRFKMIELDEYMEELLDM